MNKLIIAVILSTVATSCSSPIRSNGIYTLNDGTYEIDYKITSKTLILTSDLNRVELNVKQIKNRLIIAENNENVYYISVFDENCFKPRRTRSLIFSHRKDTIEQYRRDVHEVESFAKESDEIIIRLIKTNTEVKNTN
jgi:hypothetical protein